MDYTSMTTPQLQAECRRRGLPTARSKDALTQRLTDDDATQDAGADDDFEPLPDPDLSVEAEPERVVTELVPREAPAAQAPTVRDNRRAAGKPSTPLPPNVFRATFPVCPEGPSEEQHRAFRESTRQAALDAGREPRGGAYRIATTSDGEVYEINIRWRTP